MRVRIEPQARHLATVAMGLAVVDACAGLGVAGGLKWPNDLVAGDRKFGGILAETDGLPGPDGSVAIVVGLGVNLTWPGPLGVGATCLADIAPEVPTRDDLLGSILLALDPLIDDLSTAEGRDRLRDRYLDVLVTLGRDVRVEMPDGAFEGVAEGITELGHLLVATPSGTREVSAGDVVHLRGGTSRGLNAPE
jgi:BirA family biotin operon repressor/biotin-[acetyl-CoA-carboxylase] ligase